MFPEPFTRRLADIYPGQRGVSVLSSMRRPKAVALWDNPLRPGGIGDLHDDMGLPIDALLPGVYRVAGSRRASIMRHPLVESGALYPMNPGSVVVARALGVQPGHEVLDLAAAPGGKSLHLAAALMEQDTPTGRLALVEPVPARFHRLRANMARCGVMQADYYRRDGRGVGAATGPRFDRVLLDAPCSSEARFHVSDPQSASRWSPRKVRECARKQRRLLLSAYSALKPGGVLVYSTCAFAPEENEAVVADLLRRQPEAHCELPLSGLGVPDARWCPGLESWQGQPLPNSNAVRLLPDDCWSGFFLARIRKPV